MLSLRAATCESSGACLRSWFGEIPSDRAEGRPKRSRPSERASRRSSKVRRPTGRVISGCWSFTGYLPFERPATWLRATPTDERGSTVAVMRAAVYRLALKISDGAGRRERRSRFFVNRQPLTLPTYMQDRTTKGTCQPPTGVGAKPLDSCPWTCKGRK